MPYIIWGKQGRRIKANQENLRREIEYVELQPLRLQQLPSKPPQHDILYPPVLIPGKLYIADSMLQVLGVEAEHAVIDVLAVMAEQEVPRVGAGIYLEAPVH